MDDWLKWTLGGAAAAGLMAATGGAGAGILGPILGGTGEAAAAGTGAVAATGAEAVGATGTMLAPEAAATGSVLYPGTASAATASGLGAPGAAPAASSMMFTTPSVTGGPLSGSLAGTTMDYGTPAMLAEANTAAAAQPGLLQQAGGYAKTGMKALGAYNAASSAAGGNQPTMAPPPARPAFSGAAPQIAPQGQPAPNQNAVLAAIARRRQRGY